MLHIAGTGIDDRWHDEYRENRLNALSEPAREEYQCLQAQKEHVEGTERERILGRLRTLSRMTDVFDSNQVTIFQVSMNILVSNEANEKVGADWKNYTKNSQFRQSVYNLPCPFFSFMVLVIRVRVILFRHLPPRSIMVRFASIPESGHYPWVEKPDAVKASLRRFVVDFIINDTT